MESIILGKTDKKQQKALEKRTKSSKKPWKNGQTIILFNIRYI